MVGEITIKRLRQRGGIARRRLLRRIGQTGGVVEECVLHAQPAGLLRHPLGKGALAPGQPLGGGRGGVVRRFGHQAENDVTYRDGLPRLESELRRSAARGVQGNRQSLVELQLTVVERLENQVKRHHLG